MASQWLDLKQLVSNYTTEQQSPKPFVGNKLGHAILPIIQVNCHDLPSQMPASSNQAGIEGQAGVCNVACMQLVAVGVICSTSMV